MTVFVISDTHFQHANIIKYCRPNFSSTEEMDEHMIERWNSVVQPGDKVYHLGDVFFGSKERFAKLWPRLNGRKRLVVGNHDDIPWLSRGAFFEKVLLWRIFTDYKILLTHTPQHLSVLKEERFGSTVLNVHGHIHTNPSPEGPYKCVCVDAPGINYTPIAIEELKV